MAYSITSSARPSNESGTVMPSALAVLRLIVNLTFADSAMAAGISDRLWSLEELAEQTS
jgi:hypothetical protein